MKKFLVTLLAVLYLGMSSGIAMELHYCMGRLAGIELFSNDNECCTRCGMKEKKGGCCSDEYKFVKLEDAHKQAGNEQLKAPVEAPLWVPVRPEPLFAATPVCHKSPAVPDPPPPLPCSAQALLCIFRL